MRWNPADHLKTDRRTFLVASGVGFCGLRFFGRSASAGAASPPDSPTDLPVNPKPAKSAILIWLSGGPSHVDLWDMKPEAPKEYRGEFDPIASSAPEISLCEHLPHLARQAHHLALVRSVGMTESPNDHHAGYFYNLTGHRPEPGFNNQRRPRPDDWPYMGCVVGAKVAQHPYLPQAINLPQKAGEPGSRRPGQFAARLGVQHDPLHVIGDYEKTTEFRVPALALRGDVSADRLRDRRTLLSAIDQSERALEQAPAIRTYSKLQERAFSLLSEASKSAFAIDEEPTSVLEKYGPGVNATSMIMARRLVEARVPFVTLFWMHDYEEDKTFGCNGGAWDTHYKNFSCLKDHLVPKFDRPFAALLDDLDERGLLDETLVIVTSEMGRKPKIGDRRSGGVNGSGRDHWTPCMSVLLAGGGVRGGQVYGETDKVGAYPAKNVVGPEHIAKTIYYAMGVRGLQAMGRDGRPFHLMEEGEPLVELF